MNIGKDLRVVKLKQLAKAHGCGTILELLELSAADSVCPAICMEPHCDYTEEMEPDQTEGWCDECQSNTMCSALVLAGVI